MQAADSVENSGRDETTEVIEIKGTRTDSAALSPQSAGIGDLFGDTQALAELARSVTPISAELIEAAAVNDLHDINKIAPNSFAAAGFGAPSLPTLRGQLGEIFQLGMRRQGGNNGLGIPLSFNSVGQIDVVRGLPPVILGSTQRTGGFVNIQPKRANLSQDVGTAQVEVGEWQSYRSQFDYSALLEKDNEALRASVEVIREDSFYDYSEHKSDDLFVSYRWRPDSQSELNLFAEWYDVEWTDNAGFNRPTQALIDDGLYVTGQGRQPNGSEVPGAFALVSPESLVELPRSQVYTDPDDINGAQTFLLHGIYERELNREWAFSQRFYYQHLDREEIAQNSFVEIVDGAQTFETRAELRYAKSPKAITWFGVNLRVNDVLAYSQFTTEADLPVDLSGPLSNRRIPLTPEQQARLVELRPGVFVSPGTQYDLDGDGVGDFNLSDSTDSTSQQWGLFVQHERQWTDTIKVNGGIRADYYNVTASDPLPPAGVTEIPEDTYTDWLYGAQLSIQYQPSQAHVWYASLNQQEATSNSVAGGTVLGADQRINPLNFAGETDAFEVGYKYAPVAATWYADVAWFTQTRGLRNRDGSNTGIKTRGIEAQWFYQADQLWLTAGYSYLDARFDNSASFQDSRTVYDAFTDERPDLVAGTGVGAPNFAAFAPSTMRVQGLPDHQASVALGYDVTSQIAVGGNATYTGDYKLDFLDTVRIRDQHTLNLFAQWRSVTQRHKVRLDIYNVTDEENWSPVFEGGYFGSTLVFPELPRHLELTYTYKF
ncbi:TonB-dependent receptor [Pseudidiomarina aestuarii]|uniref:TonB-dependent receptor n=2 Tax=Pseudidiomarina aestuarii TaxID=624146 RepID=A0A7Z6ZVN3_9GAMM|nr:TonB-dependent receptor [Pseudidiomarina aestuarii]